MTPSLLLQDTTPSSSERVFNSSCEEHFRKRSVLLLLKTTRSEASLLFGNETLMHDSKRFFSAGDMALGSDPPNDKDAADARP